MKYIVYVLRTGCLKRAEQINARNFEIPLAGGFQQRTKKEHTYLYRLETILEEIWK